MIELLFPENHRHIPHRRLILNFLRSAHLLTISILAGGYYFHIDKTILLPWFVAAVVSGLSMFILDLYESCTALFEIRGVSVLLKLALLSCFPLVDSGQQIVLLMVVIIFSAFISHSTKRIRHKNLLPIRLQHQIELYSHNRNQSKVK